jgi:hypothetical protein
LTSLLSPYFIHFFMRLPCCGGAGAGSRIPK